jgi:hypothetical protein
MRMMMKVSIPAADGNRAVKDGSLPKTIMGFIEEHKPEASYFITEGGQRTALFFFDLKDSSYLPAAAEPFFMNLNAAVTMCPAMNPADLKAGLERIGRT